MINKTFRLFVSSTFSDFSEERRLLQSYVFPEIKRYCSLNGYTFQAIDLRWGVSTLAQLDQKTLELCLDEVKSSKINSHPNFLIMLGDRYGWIPLPYSIKKDEYEIILDNIEESQDKELLNNWYVLDENQIPTSFILKERKDEYVEYIAWEEIERRIRDILQNVVSNINETLISKIEKKKYFISATESEVIEGIFKYFKLTPFQENLLKNDQELETLDYENVYAYIRNIVSIDDESLINRFKDENQIEINNFKTEIKKSIDKSNILNVDVNLKDIFQDVRNGSLNYQYETILNNEESEFVKKMIGYLKSSVNKFVKDEKDISKDELEKYEQIRFKASKLKDFLPNSRIEALTAIDDYINNKNNQALVIYGKSGLGKTSLIAKAIDNSLLKYQNKKIIYRFVGSIATLSSSVEVLISILNELGINEEIRKIKNEQTLQDEPEKIEEFYYRIYEHFNNLKSEIIMFIDAVDQLSNEDEFLWLPNKLPSNLKIIISTLNDENYKEDSKYFENLKSKTINLYALEIFDKSEELINYLLSQYDRTIANSQLEYLENIYKDVNTPLYLSVASQEIRHWKSNDKTQTLAPSQKEIIEEYILNLSKIYHHDKEFVKRVFSYIYLTNGVSESELLEILSIDEEFVNYLAPDTFHINVTKELPIVIWARLHGQIKEFIKLENKNNQETMSFFHREFKEVISQIEDIKSVHEELIELLQRLIVKYQNEAIETNNWSELYIEVIKNYHLKYEFDYLLDDDSKLKSWAEFFSGLENEKYLEVITIILSQLGAKLNENNKIEESNFYFKVFYYVSSILYKSNPLRWAENYSTSLNNLAVSLYNIGKTAEAIELFKEALKIRKELYKENSLRWAEDYTRSLNNLAVSLKDIGKTVEAIKLEEEALEITKELYKENPLRWAELYTASLNNLAVSLYNIGKTAEAIELFKEALKIRKELYKENSLRWAEDYTRSLNNLAVSLNSIGKTAEAIELEEEALEITKELYKENPSRWVEAYTTSLSNLAVFLKAIGKTAEATELEKEALEITKELYKENPLRWAEAYTRSLNNLASSLKSIGKIAEAIKLEEEALKITKELYKENPSRWAEDYTQSLNNLTFSLKAIGKIAESIELLKQALEITKELYNENPSRWAEAYTRSLNNLASSLKSIGKIAEAIKIEEEALKITKELYKENPLKWAENYSTSLNNLASSLKAIGKTAEVIELEEESLKITKELYNENPSRWAEAYTRSLNNLAGSLYAIGKTTEAIELNEEALAITKELYKENPLKWAENYSTSLNNLASSLKAIGKTAEVIELEEESLKITKELYEENPLKWAEAYTRSLNNLAFSLYNIEKTAEAIELEEEALEITKELYKENPPRWAERYTKSLNNLAISLKSIGKTAEVIELEEESLKITKELYNENPSRWAEAYTRSLNNLASSLKSIGKIAEAIKLEEEALKITKELYKENPLKWAENYSTSLNNLASSLKAIGKTAEVIELEEESLKITKELYEENPLKWAEAYTRSLNNLAFSLYNIEKTAEAIELEEEALEITKELYKENPPRWAEDYTISLNNLAFSLYNIEKTAEAIELLKEALEITKKLYKENPPRWAERYTKSLNNLAISLKSIGKSAEAIELENEILRINS